VYILLEKTQIRGREGEREETGNSIGNLCRIIGRHLSPHLPTKEIILSYRAVPATYVVFWSQSVLYTVPKAMDDFIVNNEM
jgi:hypothetical protein